MPEALAAFEKAIAIKPNLERALVGAASVSTALERPEQAIGFWKRAIEVNPFMPRYHLDMARLLVQRREWSEGRSACESALKLEPINADARMLLVTCLIRTGERQRAQAEFDTLMAMRPPNEADLRRLFATLMN